MKPPPRMIVVPTRKHPDGTRTLLAFGPATIGMGDVAQLMAALQKPLHPRPVQEPQEPG